MQIELTPLGLEHSAGYVALLTDEKTARYISESGNLTPDSAAEKLIRISRGRDEYSTQRYFAIIATGTNTFLGYIAAHDPDADICPISYAVLPAWRRRGVAKAAIAQLVAYVAAHTGCRWLEALADPDSQASAATLQACGFSSIGLTNQDRRQRTLYRLPTSPFPAWKPHERTD